MTSRSGGLWSLWDMLKFKAAPYHQAIGSLNRALVLCSTIDKPVFKGTKTDTPTEGVRSLMEELLNRVAEAIAELGLDVSALAVTETIQELKDDPPLNFELLEQRLGVIDVTLRRELSQATLYAVKRDRAKYLDTTERCFGTEVDLKFPSASADIAEAGSCLALGRSTACVFHLMRVMEHGLRAINAALGLDDPTGGARNWKVLLDSIQDEITEKSQNANAGWTNKPDKAFFQEMHGSLDAVRSAWRNATMHIERRYSDEEAEHAYLMVRAFMKKLASRCDENGEPKA